jgi:putative restriction endonuclease
MVGRRWEGVVTRDELLHRLTHLRSAHVGDKRVPHKPLLLLWLFGWLAATGSSRVTYEQAEEPVSQLINEFGPPVANPAAARQRAAMPFVHLERELWDVRDGLGGKSGRTRPSGEPGSQAGTPSASSDPR